MTDPYRTESRTELRCGAGHLHVRLDAEGELCCIDRCSYGLHVQNLRDIRLVRLRPAEHLPDGLPPWLCGEGARMRWTEEDRAPKFTGLRLVVRDAAK